MSKTCKTYFLKVLCPVILQLAVVHKNVRVFCCISYFHLRKSAQKKGLVCSYEFNIEKSHEL